MPCFARRTCQLTGPDISLEQDMTIASWTFISPDQTNKKEVPSVEDPSNG